LRYGILPENIFLYKKVLNFFNDINLIYKNDFWEYDPATNVWVQKVNFGGDAREQAIGFSIGNKGYIGTGNRPNRPNVKMQQFRPSSSTADSTSTTKSRPAGA